MRYHLIGIRPGQRLGLQNRFREGNRLYVLQREKPSTRFQQLILLGVETGDHGYLLKLRGGKE